MYRKRTASLFSSRSFIGKASSCKVNRTRLLVSLCLRQPLCTYSFCDTWHSNCKNSTFPLASVRVQFQSVIITVQQGCLFPETQSSSTTSSQYLSINHSGSMLENIQLIQKSLADCSKTHLIHEHLEHQVGFYWQFLLPTGFSNRIWCWVQLTFKSQ